MWRAPLLDPTIPTTNPPAAAPPLTEMANADLRPRRRLAMPELELELDYRLSLSLRGRRGRLRLPLPANAWRRHPGRDEDADNHTSDVAYNSCRVSIHIETMKIR